jgi:hypothetical protein
LWCCEKPRAKRGRRTPISRFEKGFRDMAARRGRLTLTLLLLGVVWVGLVAWGFVALQNYSLTPGRRGVVATSYPETPPAFGNSRDFILLLFAHPHCPCTRASLQELAAIVSGAGSTLRTEVILVSPPGVAGDWDQTPLRQEAGQIPGVAVSSDRGGVRAARFGARTSGHTLLYDGTGALRFSGGITRARGTEGESPGRQMVLALFRGKGEAGDAPPVFGCPLLGECAGDGEDGEACQR